MKDIYELSQKLITKVGRVCLGSKAGYLAANRNCEPLFNATIMVQEPHSGELLKLLNTDLEMTNLNTTMGLEYFSKENKLHLFIYRESTVNNMIINGRRFPYESYDYSVSPNQGVTKKEQ